MIFDDLYQEIILDHFRHPRNRENLDRLPEARVHENPSCGDSLKLDLRLSEDGDRIERIAFDGRGCAISVASASMMTELLKGKTVAEARGLISEVLSTLRGTLSEAPPGEEGPLERFGDLAALEGISKLPVRVKCAALAWHAIEGALGETHP